MAHPVESPLAGRVVAVTGASRGIGHAIAALLHDTGAQVLAGARHAPAPALAGIEFAALDVTDEASVRAFAQRAAEAGVDSLVHNAWVGVFGPLEAATVEDYRHVFDTNVLGTLLLAKHFMPVFRQRHARALSSQLVAVTSDVSARTFANGSIYAASKHAQRALTQVAAHEGQHCGLRVTEIRPGMTDTHFNGSTPGTPERAGHLRPHDVAQAVLQALAAPAHVRVDEIVVHPVVQPVVY